MEAVNIDKWLEENTFQCPMGRVSLQQCEALRKRAKFGEKIKINNPTIARIYMPKVCENCTLWETLSKSKHIKEEIKVTDKKELATCQDCGKEFEPYKYGPYMTKTYCLDCVKKHIKKGMGVDKARKDVKKTYLTIKFANFPGLPDKLKKAATKHIRSVDHQALAYIIKGLEADGFDVERKEE